MYNPRNNQLTELARNLRRNMTREERHLWYDFLSLCHPRFRRQEIIGNYIADFYCHEARLVIELDGSQHMQPENQAYDAMRTAYFQSLNIRVLRYNNTDIIRNFSGVCEHILLTLKELGLQPTIHTRTK